MSLDQAETLGLAEAGEPPINQADCVGEGFFGGIEAHAVAP
jgi:hypothetical protein